MDRLTFLVHTMDNMVFTSEVNNAEINPIEDVSDMNAFRDNFTDYNESLSLQYNIPKLEKTNLVVIFFFIITNYKILFQILTFILLLKIR